jgi:hypothetical protein
LCLASVFKHLLGTATCLIKNVMPVGKMALIKKEEQASEIQNFTTASRGHWRSTAWTPLVDSRQAFSPFALPD